MFLLLYMLLFWSLLMPPHTDSYCLDTHLPALHA